MPKSCWTAYESIVNSGRSRSKAKALAWHGESVNSPWILVRSPLDIEIAECVNNVGRKGGEIAKVVP